MSKIYAKDYYEMNKEQFKNFENKKFFHGFGAFFSSKTSFEGKFTRIIENTPEEFEICTSTKGCGMCGVVVQGRVLLAANEDLCSGIDANGRYFDTKQLDELVLDYNDLELWEDDNEENNEIIMDHVQVVGIWYCEDTNNNTKALCKRIAELYNLPLINIGESIFN
jgi:hypothetical protein